MPLHLYLFQLLTLAAGLTVLAMPWDGAGSKPTAVQGDDPDGWSPAPTTVPGRAVVELLRKRQTSEPEYVCGYGDGILSEFEISLRPPTAFCGLESALVRRGFVGQVGGARWGIQTMWLTQSLACSSGLNHLRKPCPHMRL